MSRRHRGVPCRNLSPNACSAATCKGHVSKCVGMSRFFDFLAISDRPNRHTPFIGRDLPQILPMSRLRHAGHLLYYCCTPRHSAKVQPRTAPRPRRAFCRPQGRRESSRACSPSMTHRYVRRITTRSTKK